MATPLAGSASAKVSVTSGTSTIVAAVTGKKIKVYSYALVCTGASTAKWQSNTTDLSGAMSFAANGGISCGPGTGPYFSTAAGEALKLVTTNAVEGHVGYVIEP